MASENKLKNEQSVPMIDYNTAVQELLKISQTKKDDLDHQIVLSSNHLKNLKEQAIKEQQAFNQWKRGEQQKFDNENAKKNNEIIEKQHRLDLLVRDMERRNADLKVHEQKIATAREELIKINDERVEVEKLKVRANDLMQESNNRISLVHSKEVTANSKMDEAKRLSDEVYKKNVEACHLMDEAKALMNKVNSERVNLEKLREYVEPKIREINELQNHIDSVHKDTQTKNQEILNKIEEERILSKSLEEKKNKLDKKEIELNSRESEINRKKIIAEVK